MPSTASTVEIRPSSVDEMQALAGDLFRAHYDEIAKHKHVMRLSPDWLRYKALEQMDGLLLLAAFQDGALVGYAVTFLVTHMHACESLYGQNDVLFVDKGHRGKGVGLRLVRETERLAVSRGARMVTWGARKGSELAGLLPKVGYRATELLFTKEF